MNIKTNITITVGPSYITGDKRTVSSSMLYALRITSSNNT